MGGYRGVIATCYASRITLLYCLIMDLESKLTDEEHKQMVRLLYRFANTELDQFENAKFNTKFGPVFFSISRSSGGRDDAFHDITHLIKSD